VPQSFEYETAITIDHDAKTMRIDTTVRGVASMLRRSKFTEVTTKSSQPYYRFTGNADQIRFRKPKAERRAAPFGRKFLPGSRRTGPVSAT